MDRIVRQIDKASGETRTALFSEFAASPNIILLGDPGAGKTPLFKWAAAGTGGRYVKAQSFLVAPPRADDATLFIDGLDERREGRGDRDIVDDIVKKLFASRPARLRMSCRAADWLGENDLAAFEPYFELTGAPVVLQIDQLSPSEQQLVLLGSASRLPKLRHSFTRPDRGL